MRQLLGAVLQYLSGLLWTSHQKEILQEATKQQGTRRPTHTLFVCDLGGSSCMVKITPNAPNLDHAKK